MRTGRAIVLALAGLAPASPGASGEIDAGTADERVQWLKRHAIPLRTLDARDTDFSDLAAVGEAIGQVRVVMLGEATHGDGDAFRAKARLLKFLHARKAFSVLAWESNLLECALADKALRAGEPVAEAAGVGVFPVWSRAAQVQPVFEYVRATHGTADPLEMSGFDPQSTGALLEPLFGFLDRSYPGALRESDKAMLRALQEMSYDGSWSREPKEARRPYLDALGRLIELTGSPPGAAAERERMLMHRALQGLLDFQHAYSLPMDEIRASGEAASRRDLSMGRTLAWLAREYYPDRRIVAWAASSHLARDIGSLEGFGQFRNMFDDYVPMGKVTFELLGGDVYSVAVIAYGGRAGRINRDWSFAISAQPGSLEELCHRTGHPYLFIDLKHTPADHWLRQPLTTGAFGHTPMRGDWSRVFDAFLFIDEMHPATRLEDMRAR